MPTIDENFNTPSGQRMDEDAVPGNIAESAVKPVDLQALAEEIVALLKEELRVENERRGWHSLW